MGNLNLSPYQITAFLTVKCRPSAGRLLQSCANLTRGQTPGKAIRNALPAFRSLNSLLNALVSYNLTRSVTFFWVRLQPSLRKMTQGWNGDLVLRSFKLFFSEIFSLKMFPYTKNK